MAKSVANKSPANKSYMIQGNEDRRIKNQKFIELWKNKRNQNLPQATSTTNFNKRYNSGFLDQDGEKSLGYNDVQLDQYGAVKIQESILNIEKGSQHLYSSSKWPTQSISSRGFVKLNKPVAKPTQKYSLGQKGKLFSKFICDECESVEIKEDRKCYACESVKMIQKSKQFTLQDKFE